MKPHRFGCSQQMRIRTDNSESTQLQRQRQVHHLLRLQKQILKYQSLRPQIGIHRRHDKVKERLFDSVSNL